MMKHRNAPVWLMVLLLAVCAGAAVFAYLQYKAGVDRAGALSRLEAENRTLRERVSQAARQANVPPPEPARESPEHLKVSPGMSAGEIAARLESVRLLGQVKDQLAASKASILELQNRVHELEAGAERASVENQRLASAEADLREKLAAANRIVDAMQVELKGKTDRLLMLENATRRTSEDMRSANEKIAQFAGWARDLEDLNRRRDNVLTNLTRRYRDLTDQMRAVTLRLDNPQEGPRTQPLDLSRLQNAIQLAEDDLRQLASLNSQAARITQKMKN